MKKNMFLVPIFISLLIISSESFADISKIKQIVKSFPRQMIPEYIDKSTIDGFYILSNQNGSYLMDSSGRYIIHGQLLDLEGELDVTNAVYQNHYAIKPKDLPLNQALKEVKGNGERVLYVFADPDCPACQALQIELEDVTNVTIYTFPFALTHLHPDAINTSKQIWCSKDRLEAWKNYLMEQIEPENKSISCFNPIDQNMKLTRKYNIALTPTIFNTSGHRMTGVPILEVLEEFIGEENSESE